MPQRKVATAGISLWVRVAARGKVINPCLDLVSQNRCSEIVVYHKAGIYDGPFGQAFVNIVQGSQMS